MKNWYHKSTNYDDSYYFFHNKQNLFEYFFNQTEKHHFSLN